MHEVIHIIHRKSYKFCGLHSKKSEQMFCAVAIKFRILTKNGEIPLTF